MKARCRPAAWREIRRLVRRHRGPLTAAVSLIAVSRLAAVGLPTASRYVVDEVIAHHRTDRLVLIALLACAAVGVEAAAVFGAVQVAGVAGQRAVAGLRQDLHSRVLGFPLRRLDASHSGILAARVMTDTEQVRYLVGNGVVQLVASFLTATLALGLLFHIDALLTLWVLALVFVVALGVGTTFEGIAKGFEAVIRRQAELTGGFSQVLGGVRVVKAYAAERQETARFAKQSNQLVRESIAVVRRVSLLNSGNTLAIGALGVLLLVVGSRTVAAGDMSLGSYVMYVWLSGLLFGPVFHIAASSGELAKAVAAAGRIAELRQQRTESEEDKAAARIDRIGGAVEMEDVSYGYSPGQLALRAVNIRAPEGSTIALVGPIGSGKTTLCRLLLAYDRPTTGRILIDGRDLAGLNRRAYRSCVGVVLQDDVLFDGSLADNIRYARPRASLSDVQAAARLARCADFISQLPGGYSTVVGERGMRLSAGQRQLVAIARALLTDPRLLILDEATSNLDAATELLIQEALHRLCKSRTTIVIAHRLNTVRRADQVFVLDRGRVVEHGTPEALVARQGSYFNTRCLAELMGGPLS